MSHIAITIDANNRYTASVATSGGAVGAQGDIILDMLAAPRINQDGVTIENYPATAGSRYFDGERICISSI